MRFELTLTIPEDATEVQKEFIGKQLQEEATRLHRLLWPRVNYKTGTAFLPEHPQLREADPELEKLLAEEEEIARQQSSPWGSAR